MGGSREGANPQSRGLGCLQKLVLPARVLGATERSVFRADIGFHKVIKSISNRKERRKKLTKTWT